MTTALLGRKVGMTRVFDDVGNNLPVTVIEVGPCFVSQVKTQAHDGYDAIQLAYSDVKPRNSTQPVIGHDAKAGVSVKRVHREVRLNEQEAEAASYELGQQLNVDVFDEIKYVDVIGISKGKGTQGPMKRHGFKGQLASHGVERKHRSPGSIGGRSSNLGTGKPKKGIRMAGRMGNERVTVRSLEVVAIDKENNLMLVKGPVPGGKHGVVTIRKAIRLYKSKSAKAGK